MILSKLRTWVVFAVSRDGSAPFYERRMELSRERTSLADALAILQLGREVSTEITC